MTHPSTLFNTVYKYNFDNNTAENVKMVIKFYSLFAQFDNWKSLF